MTNKLRQELDSINLKEVIKPMFGTLELAIEHVLENSEMDSISTVDVVDYISSYLLEHLERSGMLSENNDGMKVTYDDVYDTLEGLGTPREVKDYLDNIDFESPDYSDWTISDFENGFSDYVNGDDLGVSGEYISDDELMKDMFKRHAGL